MNYWSKYKGIIICLILFLLLICSFIFIKRDTIRTDNRFIACNDTILSDTIEVKLPFESKDSVFVDTLKKEHDKYYIKYIRS